MAIEMLQEADDLERATGADASMLTRDSVPRATLVMTDLRGLVQRAVIPRLHQAVRERLAPSQALLTPMLSRAEGVGDGIDLVAERLLRDDIAAVCARIDASRACGRPLDRIYVDVLLPAAVRLSELRAGDLCGSAEAMIAFCNLQIILRRYASDFLAEGEQPCNGLRALLASPTCGAEGADLQMFGLVIASEFFRRAGWDAWAERSLTSPAFKDTVLTQWFDLIEVLATSDDDLDDIASGIKLIRRRAPNRRVGIVACGRVFSERPEFVRLVGADHSASDPLNSLARATQFVAGRTQRRHLS